MACCTVGSDKALLKSAICRDKPITFVEHVVLLFNVNDACSNEMWRACKASSTHHSYSRPFT